MKIAPRRASCLLIDHRSPEAISWPTIPDFSMVTTSLPCEWSSRVFLSPLTLVSSPTIYKDRSLLWSGVRVCVSDSLITFGSLLTTTPESTPGHHFLSDGFVTVMTADDDRAWTPPDLPFIVTSMGAWKYLRMRNWIWLEREFFPPSETPLALEYLSDLLDPLKRPWDPPKCCHCHSFRLITFSYA